MGGATFWITAAIGWVVIIAGVRAGLHDRELKPAVLGRWLIGTLVLHDGIWLPFLATIGAAASLVIRKRVPAFVVWAVMTSAVLSLVGWPFVRGYGRRADVPSALQRNYAHGLLAYIGATWALAIGAAIVSRHRIARSRIDGDVKDRDG